MLAWFRKLAKQPLAVVVIGLVSLSFVLWQTSGRGGGGGLFGGGMKADAVVQAGAHTVDAAAFRRMFDQAVQQVGEQARRPVSSQEALAAGFDKQVADRAGDDMAFLEMVKGLGLTGTDKQVVAKIHEIPAFFDPVTGSFSKKSYDQKLAENGLTSKVFEQSLRDEAAQNQLEAGMAGGLRAPMIVTALEAAYTRQARTFSWFAVPPAAVGGQAKPDDAELNQFIKDHAAQLKRPEMRQLSVVRFSAAALAPTLAVDPAAVQKRFDFEKDTLSQPDKRSLIQIAAKDAKTASDVAAKLKAGGDPAAVAKAAGATLQPFAQVPKSAIPDAKVADAAFALGAGEVSAPVQGGFGWAVVKVTAVTPGKAATLDDARPKIEAEVKKDAAKAKVDAQVQKFEDARAKGATVAAAAQAVGATVAPIGPVTAQGADAKKQPTGLPPKVLEAAFRLPAGGDSDTIDAGEDDYWAVRVDKIRPPALPSLEEIRPELTQYVTLQDMLKRMNAKGEALAETIRKGQSVDAAAATVGTKGNRGVGITRESGGQTFSADLLGRIFSAKPGEVIVAPDNKLGVVVARIDQVSAPAAAEVAPLMAQGRMQTSRAVLGGMAQAVRITAREKVKPKIDYKRAREAVGGSGAGATPAAPSGPAS